MTQSDNRPVGVPGGMPRPGGPAPGPRPSPSRPADEADGLLSGVEDELQSLDQRSAQEQVAVFDRIHTTLADALARTADTGGPPAGGQPGA